MAHEDADLIQQAVCLAVSISQSQCFMEGNKRTGYESMGAFPRIDGYWFSANPLDAAQWLLTVANASADASRDAAEQQFVEWLRADVIRVN